MGQTKEVTVPKFRRRTIALAFASLCALLVFPLHSMAAPTQLQPQNGHHFDHLELAPLVIFDPGVDFQPKWVLLAVDPEMKQTVRYCRQFVWAAPQNAVTTGGNTMAWGCNRWATGQDQGGNDHLLALVPGRAYYWQVIGQASPQDETEVKSAVSSFYIDAEKSQSIAAISDKINGTVFDDGTQLNLGAAAFVNSKVRVTNIASARIATYAFRLRATHVGAGGVDLRRSYIRVSSPAGTRNIRVKRSGKNTVQAVFTLTKAERRLSSKRFTYQAFLRSKQNNAVVRSQGRVLLIKKKAAKKNTKAPKWTPDKKRR